MRGIIGGGGGGEGMLELVVGEMDSSMSGEVVMGGSSKEEMTDMGREGK